MNSERIFQHFHLVKYNIPTCSGHPGLTGKRLDLPRKIVLLFLFGFEADILEITLKQQHDMVDQIFLVESTQSHRGVGYNGITPP